MSTSPTRMRPLAAAICAAFLTMSSVAFAQTTVATVPVGYMTYNLESGKTTPVGISLSESNVYTGPAATVGTNTISAAGVSWSPNQFANPAAPHFVNIMAGAQVGRTLLITGNTANTITVAEGDTPLNAAGFAIAAGDRIEIVPGDTLGTLFGNTPETLALQGGANREAADVIEIFNGAVFDAYYFNTTLGHWVVGESQANANNTVLQPWAGLMITRKGPNTSFVVTGRVPSTSLMTRLPGSTSNVVAVRFPTDTTLAGLTYTGGTWLQGTTPFKADTVSLWNGTKWESYWMKPDNKWYAVGGDNSDKSGTPVPAGSVISVLKRGSVVAGSGTFFSQALPYSLN